MEFTDYDTRLAAYAVLVDDQDRVLLTLWNQPEVKTWTMPGGGVELDETPEQAAVREVFEETGYAIRLGPLLGVVSFVVPGDRRMDGSGRALKSVRLVFVGQIVGGELTHEADGTTDEARWVPLDEVSGLPRVELVDAAIEMRRRSR